LIAGIIWLNHAYIEGSQDWDTIYREMRRRDKEASERWDNDWNECCTLFSEGY
jgi:hypothetical protein